MKKILDYTVCKGSTPYALEQAVSKLLIEGWQPLGGVGASDIHYLQAMVKYADN